MQNHIALYNADGELLERINDRRLERLQSLGRIARVVRHRKGHVNRAVQVRLPGDPRPTRLLDYLGTRYSSKQRLSDGHTCWRLRSLGDRPSETDLAPADVRSIFLQVVVDCMAREAGATPNGLESQKLRVSAAR